MRDAQAKRGKKFVASPLILKRPPNARPPQDATDYSWRPPKFIFSKHEESDAARAYVLELSGLTSELFGEISYKTVATTASVALQRPITQRQVRKWTHRPSIAWY